MFKSSMRIALGLAAACQVWTSLAADPAVPSFAPPGAQPQAALLEFLPEVVARYNDQTITAAELREFLVPQMQVMLSSGRPFPEEMQHRLAHDATSYLVDRQLLLKQCSADGISPDKAEAEAKLDEIEKSIGKERFEQGLAMQKTTRAELTDRFATEMAIQKWVETKIVPTVEVSDAAIKSYYQSNADEFQKPEMVSASHILIKFDDDASDQDKAAARKQAEELLAQLKKGADFAKLAEEHSACPSGKRGGDLGSFGKGQMVPAFEAAAFALKDGELSDVVETRFGYHIIKGGDRTEAETVSLDEARDQIRANLSQEEVGKAMQAFMDKTRTAAKVQILIPTDK